MTGTMTDSIAKEFFEEYARSMGVRISRQEAVQMYKDGEAPNYVLVNMAAKNEKKFRNAFLLHPNDAMNTDEDVLVFAQ